MTFLSKAMSKASGFTLTLPCLWQSMLTTLVVQRILRSEESSLFVISWWGKPLFSWCVLSFSVVWTIATLYSLTSLLTKCTAFKKKIKIMQPKSFFAKSKHEHVTPLLKKYHWLPVKEIILFKIATFAFRFFDGTLPPYLSSCLSAYTPFGTLRSSCDEKNLSSARWKLKGFGHRSFSDQAPNVWNSLPPHIRHSRSLSQFRTSLKTFLSTSVFSELPWSPERFEIIPLW